jgi:hypothetical protein
MDNIRAEDIISTTGHTITADTIAEPFVSFPKLYRMRGPVIVTEKIDGTNAQIYISDTEFKAGSRTRWIKPGDDNFGFAAWAYSVKDELIRLLGPGKHYGEWWGKGIQRNYGMKERIFSLFNTSRWNDPATLLELSKINVRVVPVLYSGPFDTVIYDNAMISLKSGGSFAAPGFMNPEGIVLYDTQSGTGFKRTFDYDETGKGGIRDKDGNVL